MEFEWDEEKAAKTKMARGLDFWAAARLWDDPDSIEVPVRSESESRCAKIGMLDGQVHTAIFTLRDTKIRIISIRRAHPKEIVVYEKK